MDYGPGTVSHVQMTLCWRVGSLRVITCSDTLHSTPLHRLCVMKLKSFSMAMFKDTGAQTLTGWQLFISSA